MLMTVDHVAPIIEKAIMQRRRVATIDSRWAVVTALWQLIPNCLWPKLQVRMQ